jgi:hypothetical protein
MRFSLKALLILITVVGLFLGYAECRRQFLIRETESLKHLGVYVITNNDHYKPVGFWPATPERAYFGLFVDGPNRIGESIDRVYSVAEAKECYGELMNRIRRLGIKDVQIRMLHCPECCGSDTLYSVDEFDRYIDDGEY